MRFRLVGVGDDKAVDFGGIAGDVVLGDGVGVFPAVFVILVQTPEGVLPIAVSGHLGAFDLIAVSEQTHRHAVGADAVCVVFVRPDLLHRDLGDRRVGDGEGMVSRLLHSGAIAGHFRFLDGIGDDMSVLGGGGQIQELPLPVAFSGEGQGLFCHFSVRSQGDGDAFRALVLVAEVVPYLGDGNVHGGGQVEIGNSVPVLGHGVAVGNGTLFRPVGVGRLNLVVRSVGIGREVPPGRRPRIPVLFPHGSNALQLGLRAVQGLIEIKGHAVGADAVPIAPVIPNLRGGEARFLHVGDGGGDGLGCRYAVLLRRQNGVAVVGVEPIVPCDLFGGVLQDHVHGNGDGVPVVVLVVLDVDGVAVIVHRGGQLGAGVGGVVAVGINGEPTQRVSGGDDKIVADGVNEGDGDDGGHIQSSECFTIGVVTSVIIIIRHRITTISTCYLRK